MGEAGIGQPDGLGVRVEAGRSGPGGVALGACCPEEDDGRLGIVIGYLQNDRKPGAIDCTDKQSRT